MKNYWIEETKISEVTFYCGFIKSRQRIVVEHRSQLIRTPKELQYHEMRNPFVVYVCQKQSSSQCKWLLPLLVIDHSYGIREIHVFFCSFQYEMPSRYFLVTRLDTV